MSLQIGPEIFSRIEGHCVEAYPEEACGVLIGPLNGGFAENGAVAVTQARRLKNAWEKSEKTRRFEMPADELAALEREFVGRQDGIVGIYHSHPDYPAWPSPFDLSRAWPNYSYLILATKRRWLVDARVWRLSEDGRSFLEVQLEKGAKEHEHQYSSSHRVKAVR